MPRSALGLWADPLRAASKDAARYTTGGFGSSPVKKRMWHCWLGQQCHNGVADAGGTRGQGLSLEATRVLVGEKSMVMLTFLREDYYE